MNNTILIEGLGKRESEKNFSGFTQECHRWEAVQWKTKYLLTGEIYFTAEQSS